MSIFTDPMVVLMRRVTELEKKLTSALSALHSLYPVWNENTPAQITAQADNYAPGDYAVLRLSSDAARHITGISGGKKGRQLIILNVGAQNIFIDHESASSLAANRITTSTAANITLNTMDNIVLYYDSTSLRWRVIALVQ